MIDPKHPPFTPGDGPPVSGSFYVMDLNIPAAEINEPCIVATGFVSKLEALAWAEAHDGDRRGARAFDWGQFR